MSESSHALELYIGGAVLSVIAWELLRGFFVGQGSVERLSTSLPTSIPAASTSSHIEIGDVVIFKYSDDPDAIRSVTLSYNKSDPANRFISVESPLGGQLLGQVEDQVIEIHVPGGNRQLHILAIKKALSNIKGPLDNTNGDR